MEYEAAVLGQEIAMWEKEYAHLEALLANCLDSEERAELQQELLDTAEQLNSAKALQIKAYAAMAEDFQERDEMEEQARQEFDRLVYAEQCALLGAMPPICDEEPEEILTTEDRGQ